MDCLLITHTPEPLKTIASAASLCYSGDHICNILNTITEDKQKGLIKHLLTSGHMSPFEHVSFTFGIEGVSRALTHQLVRHRMASYSQQSMRYVRMENASEYVLPPSCRDGGPREYIVQVAMRAALNTYNILIEEGVPPEDARYVLPNGWQSKIIVTMNCRELFHFFELRLCCRAQWEIRALAQKMFNQCYSVAPEIFQHAGAPCVCGNCHEQSPCATPYIDFDDMLTRNHEKK